MWFKLETKDTKCVLLKYSGGTKASKIIYLIT